MSGGEAKPGGRLRVDRVYPHSVGALWRALTEPELLGRWLMPNDFQARVGHRFTFRTDPGPGFDGIVHCEVLELEAERYMVWSWKGGPLDTVVRFDLHEHPRGVRLVVTHTGFRGLKSRLVQWILGIGNRTLYGKRLPALLDEIEHDVPAVSADDEACMSPWQRVLIFLTGRVQPRSGPKPPPTS